jgi:hypothetical protein
VVGGGVAPPNLQVHEDNQAIENDNVDELGVDPPPNIDFYKSIEHNAVSFVAKLYNKPDLARCHVQSIVSDTTNFLSSGFIGSLKDEVFNILENNIPCNFADLKCKFETLESPFKKLSTEHQRFKFLKEAGYLIEPVEFVIDSRLDDKTDAKGNTTYEPTNFIGHFIPLRHVLKRFFEMPKVLDMTLDYMKELLTYKEIVSNFIQCQLWKEKTVNFRKEDIVMPLFLYFDDYETCNPLGTSSGIHKLGATYISLPVLPLQFQSTLDNIFLVSLFHSSDRIKTTQGNQHVFKIIIDELIYLETTGILISTNKGDVRVFFVLGLILGDNLGLHSILGFVEGFTANFPCRFCIVNKSVLIKQVEENTALLRTVENYESDLCKDNYSTTGIRHRCIFNDIPSFHVTSNCSVDLMHDVLEGVCSYDMSHILRYLIIEKKYLSVETFNFRVSTFNYSHVERSNRPPCISKDNLKKGLRTSSSEMLCLTRYLGVMIGDLIPAGDRVWDLYILLRKFLCMLLSKDTQKNISVLLKTLISEHHQLYLTLFDDTLKAKFHHLLHYPRMFDMVGPLVNTWSMRYESKHKESKTTAAVSVSRKNITFTLALKHQLKFAYRLLENKGLEIDFALGPGEDANITLLTNYALFADKLPLSLKDNGTCFVTKWARINGTKYKCGDVLISCFEDDTPQFDLISTILVGPFKDVFFITKLLTTLGFDYHTQAFQVEMTTAFGCASYNSLISPFPTVMSLMADGNSYVALRYEL